MHLLALLFLLLEPPKDVDGWLNIKWGMTIADAQRAMGGERIARNSTAPHNPSGVLLDRLIIKDVRVGNLVGTAVVQAWHASDAVQGVSIYLSPEDELQAPKIRQEALDTLRAAYGEPTHEANPPGVKTEVWKFSSSNVVLFTVNADIRIMFINLALIRPVQ